MQDMATMNCVSSSYLNVLGAAIGVFSVSSKNYKTSFTWPYTAVKNFTDLIKAKNKGSCVLIHKKISF